MTIRESHSTYRSVDRLIAGEVGVLAQAMVRLAECHAWTAVGHATEVDRGQAAEKGLVPRLRGRGGFGLDDLAGLGKDLVEAVLPVVDVVVGDGP
jgi:hypothetical protein